MDLYLSLNHVSWQSRSQMFVPLAPQTAEPNYFSHVQTHGFVYSLCMNILTCAQLKLDDSAEFQIVPTISNQISILYSINLVLKRRWVWLDLIEFSNRAELRICKYKVIHKNLVDGFSHFQRFVERAE
jgi:hypothetical protein